MSDHDQKIGTRFFISMIAGLVVLSLLYIVAHGTVQARELPVAALLERIDQAREQGALAQDEEPEATAAANDQGPESLFALENARSSISEIVSVLRMLKENDRLDAEVRQQLSASYDRFQAQNGSPEPAVLEAELRNLETLLTALALPYFWIGIPERFLEILTWALAGILVNQIITTGTYMRWKRFYASGIWMHISHLITVPLMVLVFMMLFSQVVLSLTIAGAGNLTIDLDNPLAFVALSFVLAVQPWELWSTLRETAARILKQPGPAE